MDRRSSYLLSSKIFMFRQIYACWRIFRYIPAYSEPCIILRYSEPWYTQNPGILWTRDILRTRLYSEPWHTQNHKDIQNICIFRTVAYSETKAYSEPCQTSTMECFGKMVNGYNHFRSFAFHVLYFNEINIMKFFNARLIFTPKVFILCKEVWESRWPGAEGGVWYNPSKLYNNIVYYFWLSIFSILRIRHNPYRTELIPLEFLV